MSVQGPSDASRRYISGAAKPGVYMGRMKLPSLDSTSRAAPKSIITARSSLVMKMLAGLMSRRSEEHTSELQSPCNLVCRLLLEKKNCPSRSLLGTTAPIAVGLQKVLKP